MDNGGWITPSGVEDIVFALPGIVDDDGTTPPGVDEADGLTGPEVAEEGDVTRLGVEDTEGRTTLAVEETAGATEPPLEVEMVLTGPRMNTGNCVTYRPSSCLARRGLVWSSWAALNVTVMVCGALIPDGITPTISLAAALKPLLRKGVSGFVLMAAAVSSGLLRYILRLMTKVLPAIRV